MHRRFQIAAMALGALSLGGCMTVSKSGRDTFAESTSLAYFPKKTQTQLLLNGLPPPERPVAIAVSGFTDQTGQFKPTEAGQPLSPPVPAGAGAILVNALQRSEEHTSAI